MVYNAYGTLELQYLSKNYLLLFRNWIYDLRNRLGFLVYNTDKSHLLSQYHVGQFIKAAKSRRHLGRSDQENCE